MGAKNTQFNTRASYNSEYVSGKYVGYHSEQLADASPNQESDGMTATGGISGEYTDDEDGKEKTQTKDVKYAKSSKLGEKDAMYISVIQQLMQKIETLESKVKALEEA